MKKRVTNVMQIVISNVKMNVLWAQDLLLPLHPLIVYQVAQNVVRIAPIVVAVAQVVI